MPWSRRFRLEGGKVWCGGWLAVGWPWAEASSALDWLRELPECYKFGFVAKMLFIVRVELDGFGYSIQTLVKFCLQLIYVRTFLNVNCCAKNIVLIVLIFFTENCFSVFQAISPRSLGFPCLILTEAISWDLVRLCKRPQILASIAQASRALSSCLNFGLVLSSSM